MCAVLRHLNGPIEIARTLYRSVQYCTSEIVIRCNILSPEAGGDSENQASLRWLNRSNETVDKQKLSIARRARSQAR